jgi:hypothetical protein
MATKQLKFDEAARQALLRGVEKLAKAVKATLFEKWFRFLPWSTQKRIGRLSRYVMMNHCGSIIAHGRELRIYRRLLICRAL